MNLKVPGAILPLGCAILSTRAKTVWGLLQLPFGEVGLICFFNSWSEQSISIKKSINKVISFFATFREKTMRCIFMIIRYFRTNVTLEQIKQDKGILFSYLVSYYWIKEPDLQRTKHRRSPGVILSSPFLCRIIVFIMLVQSGSLLISVVEQRRFMKHFYVISFLKGCCKSSLI